MSELLAWLSSTAALLGWAVLQPAAAYIVGAFWGGYAIGASKNKTALIEIGRGVGAGIVAGLIVYAAQRMIGGGR